MALYGLKTISWFDVWSLEHLVSGVTLCGIARLVSRSYVLKGEGGGAPALEAKITVILALLLAYLWESIEFYLEAGYSSIEAVTYWFQGVEFWGNRLITDPAMTLLGVAIGLRYPRALAGAHICPCLARVAYFPIPAFDVFAYGFWRVAAF